MWRQLIFTSVLFVAAKASNLTTFQLQGPKVIDLSYPFDENVPYWNFYRNFSIEVFHKVSKSGTPFTSEIYESETHGGTHMDSPYHFAKDGWTITDIPLNRLIAPGVVIDVSDKAETNHDYQLTVEDVQKWEEIYGPIPDGSVVLVRTGWDRMYSNVTTFYGIRDNNWDEPHFPGIHPDTAAWLVKNKVLYGIGLDSSSLDYGPSKAYEAHQILLGENIYGLEVVANLGLLPPRGFTLFVMPMKIKGASGAPTRVVALVP